MFCCCACVSPLTCPACPIWCLLMSDCVAACVRWSPFTRIRIEWEGQLDETQKESARREEDHSTVTDTARLRFVLLLGCCAWLSDLLIQLTWGALGRDLFLFVLASRVGFSVLVTFLCQEWRRHVLEMEEEREQQGKLFKEEQKQSRQALAALRTAADEEKARLEDLRLTEREMALKKFAATVASSQSRVLRSGEESNFINPAYRCNKQPHTAHQKPSPCVCSLL